MAASSSASSASAGSGRATATARPVVEEVDPSGRAEWDDYVESKPNATLYNLFGWKAVAEEAYSMRAPFLIARDAPGGPVRGVLPLVRVPRPFMSYFTTGLFGAYAPLLADEERHARALIAEAKTRVEAGEAKHMHLKLLGVAPEGEGLERRDLWVTARLDLGPDEEARWRSLPRKERWALRSALRAGFARAERLNDIEGFYGVLFENMHRKGAPIYGQAFFRAMARAFGPRVEVLTLTHGGRAVSGAFVVAFKDTIYVPFASSLPTHFRQRINHLLYWEVMRRGRALGCTTLDFGSSLAGSSGLEFKVEWGARVEPIHSYIYSRDEPGPTLDPRESRVASSFVRGWARLPRGVARALGPALCRWIA